MNHVLRASAAGLLCAVLCAGGLIACGHKEVSLEDETISNFDAPQQGEKIVELTIKDYGTVKIKLFPDETPQGVENFTKLVEQGFYDELIFHRVIDGFMIQGGDPKGDGTGGKDAFDGNGFQQTISPNLHHVAGAVAYAIGGDKLNKSQFYIVTGEQQNKDSFQLLEQQGLKFSEDVKELYYTWGGYPYLDNGYEIFGQVFDGLEYCLEIAKVPTNSSDKPKTPVVIEKAQVVEYDGTPPKWLTWEGKEPGTGEETTAAQ